MHTNNANKILKGGGNRADQPVLLDADLQNAIHVPQVIRDKQVTYLYLVAAADLASMDEIGRLALYALLQAAMAHRKEWGQTPCVNCLCDEAQTLIAQNIANVLAQSRSHGLVCILDHQTTGQLCPPGGSGLARTGDELHVFQAWRQMMAA